MKKFYRIVLAMLVLASLVLSGCAGAELPDREFTLGVVSGSSYTSEYAGIGLELGQEWQMLGADELQELPDNVREMLKDTSAGDLLEHYNGLMDMQAVDPATGATVNINFTVIRESERKAYARMTEEDTLDVLLRQKDTLLEAYARMGIENSDVEKVSVQFLGEPHYALRLTGQIYGMDICSVQLQNYRLGPCGMTLTATTMGSDDTQSLLDLFYAIG